MHRAPRQRGRGAVAPWAAGIAVNLDPLRSYSHGEAITSHALAEAGGMSAQFRDDLPNWIATIARAPFKGT